MENPHSSKELKTETFSQYLKKQQLLPTIDIVNSDEQQVFASMVSSVSATDYSRLIQTCAVFYSMPISESAAFNQADFDDAFWRNWQKRHQARPLWRSKKHIYIGVYTPQQEIDENSIAFKFQCKCVKVLLHNQQDAQQYLQHIQKKSNDKINTVDAVESIINEAINRNASDIHLEPYASRARIRLRCDGVLIKHSHIENSLLQQMLSRIKVLGNMDISERRLPQDGRMLFKSQSHGQRDLRLSSMPTLFGEKMVIRILRQQQYNIPLQESGLNERQIRILSTALKTRHGMILTTGPTGSGKTNTLYSLIEQLNQSDVNIVSVEDPVEIYLKGVNQINTNQKAGLTFARALRGILRQDPDIVMVGEIRDSETADIAIKAAQTGHLLLSSLHTNNAIGSIARLSDMGIASYRLGAALKILIAQRLIRRLCQSCKRPLNYKADIWQRYNLDKNTPLFEAVGCPACNHGYAGRTGIFEIIQITPTLFDAIINQNQQAIEQALKNQQYISLRQTGIEKITKGISSVDELERVL